MPLRILTNTQSLFAQTNLGISQRAMKTALERLSSGMRINHSYDDPAGYLYSVQMQFAINGFTAGTNNMKMAVELMNTADSYTRTITENLTRCQELATQARNGLLTADQRAGLNFEFRELIAEIDRLANNASYNGRVLLNGSLVGVTTQSGYSLTDVIGVSVASMNVSALGLSLNQSISTLSGAASAIGLLTSAIVTVVNPGVASIGAQSAGWLKSTDAQEMYITNLKAARSRIWDADIAEETTNLTNAQVIVQSGIAALAQANSAQTLALGLIGGG